MKTSLALIALSLCLSTVSAFASPSTPHLNDSYNGVDQLGHPCAIRIGAEISTLDFQISDSQGDYLEIQSVAMDELEKKLQEDTLFRKEQDKNYDPKTLSVHYYRYFGKRSALGTYPETHLLALNWHDGDLSSARIELTSSKGPFNKMKSLFCFVR